MTTVFVAGALANKPGNGGDAWVRMTWVTGLRRLGFDVVFVEELLTQNCVDAAGRPTSLTNSVNLAYWRAVVQRFDLAGRAALLSDDASGCLGMEWGELVALAGDAVLLCNVSGHLVNPTLLKRFGHRAYIDVDPGFTQFWHHQGIPGARLDGHDSFFTVGLNIGSPGCPIPTDGLAWRPLLPFVVLEDWPVADASDVHRLTTIASWRGAFGPIEHDGHRYGSRAHEFRKIVDLPSRAPQTFEVALAIHPADERDRGSLLAHGWHLVAPGDVAGDPDRFRRYVQDSGGEFATAQGIYVETSSGWFSDRTVRYLASGHPAIVADTGLGAHLPVGEGLLCFADRDGAVAAALELAGDPARHAKSARALAETHFASDVVLGRFLSEVGVAP